MNGKIIYFFAQLLKLGCISRNMADVQAVYGSLSCAVSGGCRVCVSNGLGMGFVHSLTWLR